MLLYRIACLPCTSQDHTFSDKEVMNGVDMTLVPGVYYQNQKY